MIWRDSEKRNGLRFLSQYSTTLTLSGKGRSYKVLNARVTIIVAQVGFIKKIILMRDFIFLE